MNFNRLGLHSVPKREVVKALLIDIAALAVVFLTPTLGQMIQAPFWMIEPMRLMVIISIAHTGRLNSFLLAAILPLFSWMVSGHPLFLKMIIMTVELLINVSVFYLLMKKVEAVFLSMLIAIVGSKIICYTLYLVFSSVVNVDLESETETGFLIAQVITTLLFSTYTLLILRRKAQ
jgi:hypothetical protein